MSSTAETKALISLMQKALSDLSDSLDKPEGADQNAMAVVQAGFGALEADVINPDLLLCRIALSYDFPVAVAAVVDLGIPELLAEEGEMSSTQIQERTGLPKGKVSRLLRLLAGRKIFSEVKPEVWTHTKVSKALVSKISFKEITERPLERYADSNPVSAFIWNCVQQGGPCAVAMPVAFRDPAYRASYAVDKCPFNFAFNTEKTFWQWMESVDGGCRVRNFGKSMEVTNSATGDFSWYPWKELGEDVTIVDVGGGVGSAVASILPTAPNVKKAYVQDRPPVIEAAKKYWSAQNPSALSSGQVELQPHDFMTPQPVKGAEVYFIRYTVQNWADHDVEVMLRHLSEAAASHSRLFIVDAVTDHACHDVSEVAKDAVEGAYPPPFPAPLPANGGRAAEFNLLRDMAMMHFINGEQRTHAALREIAGKAGWKPKKVYDAGASKVKITEFVKI